MPPVEFSLYVVTDRHLLGDRAMASLLREIAGVGRCAVQIREKDLETRALLSLAEGVVSSVRPAGCPVLINDRIDVALAVGADGVHLRGDSLPIEVARQLVGPDRLIGVSAHSVEEVRRAEIGGADFVVLGPVFDTPSKRSYGAPIGLQVLEAACRGCRVPVFAIGGITSECVPAVRRAGAYGIAAVSAILAAPDVIGATRALLSALDTAR